MSSVKEHNNRIKDQMNTKLQELEVWNKMYKVEHSITFDYYMEVFTQTMAEYNELRMLLLTEVDKNKYRL